MRNFYNRMELEIRKKLVEEQWEATPVEVDGAVWHITESCKRLEASCITIVNGFIRVFTPEVRI